jgi:D-alanyl-D-alanine carboxypeptidase (penicillin-binding protein 5/6)
MRRIASFLFAILFIAAPALAAEKKAAAATEKKAAPAKKPAPAKAERKPESPGIAKPFPVDEQDANVFPYVDAQAAILCDAATGKVLYEKNADDQRGVASTQKLMTALIIAEEGGLDNNVHASSVDSDCEPTKLGLKDGDIYKRYDLLKVMLIKSENDVARCLARDNAGSIEAFAQKMNAKARTIGMKNSNFVNPNGLTAPGQGSTARDMARLALWVYRNKVLRGIISTRVLAWKTPAGKTMVLENTNKLLKSFGLCNGMKTGYTDAAGNCLVASATSGGKHVICVVLGDKHREGIWNDSYRLLNWGLNQLKE